MKRNPIFLALAVCLASRSLTAEPLGRVIASTSWTAAYARAAGASDVFTIAPLELKHPPEYELKPSDLAAVNGARFLVYSGYERFAKRLAETAGSAGLSVTTVYTDNIPATFKEEAKKLALLFGTLPEYEAWARSFDAMTEAMRKKVAAAYPDKRVVAHKFLKTYAEWLGFEVVGTFGPGEPSPAHLLELASAKPALIIDNYHNASGASIAAATKAPVVTLINFPGKDGTRSIEDVFAHNERAFLEAARQRDAAHK